MVIVIQCTVFIWIKCRKIKVSHFLLVLELLFSALFFYKNQMTKNCCLSFSIGFEIVIQCTLFYKNLMAKNSSLPFLIGLNNCHSVHSFLRWWKILVSDFLFVLSLIVLSLIARFFCKNWTERKNEVSSICLELSPRAQIQKRRKSSIS